MSTLDSLVSSLSHFLQHWTTLASFVALLLFGGLATWVLQRLLHRHFNRLARHAPISTGTLLILRRAISVSLWLAFGLLLLRQAGVNVDGIWTMLASMLAVIGVGLLAVWTMVSNITASLFIWIWRPYELGETIELLPANFKGRAVDRSLMYTTLREEDGTLLMVPNNQFFQNVTRRWPSKPRITDYEAWEAEQKFSSPRYAGNAPSSHSAQPEDNPKENTVT